MLEKKSFEEGTYVIYSKLSGDKVIDIEGVSKKECECAVVEV